MINVSQTIYCLWTIFHLPASVKNPLDMPATERVLPDHLRGAARAYGLHEHNRFYARAKVNIF